MIVATVSGQPRTCLLFFLVDSFHLESESERASLVAQRVKNLSGDPGFSPWDGKILWRRKWQPTLLFLSGTFHGQRSLAGCGLWGCKESDVT